MSNKIEAMQVERDQYGYWTHPEYEELLKRKGIEYRIEYRDEDEIDMHGDGYDISTWQPAGIKGDGWFVGSIHDTKDGAVCIWLRQDASND